MKILIASSDPVLRSLIRRALSRFHYQWTEADNGLDAFQKAMSHAFDLLILDFRLPRMKAVEILKRITGREHDRAVPVIVLTVKEEERLEIEEGHFPRTVVMVRPFSLREFVGKVREIFQSSLHVACLGGGTGLFTLLSGLKTLPGLSLYSIVSMSDDGGSTGKLRDMFGVLPPGDIRRSLVALSNAPDLLNELIQYRFVRGGALKGHNIGNLLLTALSEMRGSMTHAVKSLSEILNIEGAVIPVTETDNTLNAELENGERIEGESSIGLFQNRPLKLRIRHLWQEPRAYANPDALEVLGRADYIVLGPGDLFTSVISNIIVEGIADALRSNPGKKIYICNVMTKPGETMNFTVTDHAREIIKYLGSDCLDYVISSSTPYSVKAQRFYLKKNQAPVLADSGRRLKRFTRAKWIHADVGSETELVRHDSLKLANVLKKIFFRRKKN